MIGYVENGYRLWDINMEKIIFARDVKFDENHCYLKQNHVEIKLEETGKEHKIKADNTIDIEDVRNAEGVRNIDVVRNVEQN